MDVLEYLNSNDVREYLRSIDYKPSLLESVYIIFHSRMKTLREKHDAWKYLTENTEDLILNEEVGERWAIKEHRKPEVYGRSVHGLLKKYMAEEKRTLDFFYEDTENCVYVPSFLCRRAYSSDGTSQPYHMSEAGIYFGTFAEAQRYCLKEVAEDSEVAGYSVSKHLFSRGEDRYGSYIRVEFNTSGEVMSESLSKGTSQFRPEPLRKIWDEQDAGISIEYDFFGNLWFDIPIPFKKGDIVIARPYGWGMETSPFVLYDTVPMFKKKQAEEGHVYREGCDSSDMNASGWTVGFGDYPDEINDDVMADYLDLEYYRGNYMGKERLLPLLAGMMKGTYDVWEYERIKEEILRTADADCRARYMFDNCEDIKAIIDGKPTWE